jgi:hypothetical protein
MQPQHNTTETIQPAKPQELLLQVEGYKYIGHGWQFFSCGVVFRKTERGQWGVVDAAPIIRKEVGLEPLAAHRAGAWGYLAPTVQEKLLANHWQYQWIKPAAKLPSICHSYGKPFGVVQARCHTTYGWPLPAYVPCSQAPYFGVVSPVLRWGQLQPVLV